jgi:hypothetical protein
MGLRVGGKTSLSKGLKELRSELRGHLREEFCRQREMQGQRPGHQSIPGLPEEQWRPEKARWVRKRNSSRQRSLDPDHMDPCSHGKD